MNDFNQEEYTAQSIIKEMGWDWDNLEHPARMVAEYCAKKLNELGGNVSSNDFNEPHDMYDNHATKNYDDVESGSVTEEKSFMAMRAGKLGETYGDSVALSKCCHSQIVANNICSNCGKEAEEMQNEEVKLSESINKIKNRFTYLN